MIKSVKIFIAVFLILAAGSAVYAVDISRMGAGARSISLGKAYTGALGDVNSMFINPAGLSTVNTFELSSMYVNYAGDVSYTLLSAAYPFRFGVVGVGYLGAFSGDLAITTVESTGRIGAVGLFNYSSNIMSVSYAGNPSDRLSLGLSGKYYSKGSPQVSGGNGSGMSVDMGAVYKLSDSLKIGLSGQNLLNTGIKWDGGITETIPYDLKAGLVFNPNNKMTAMLDAEKVQDSDVLLRAGAEYEFKDDLWLRIGAEQMQAGIGSSYWNYSGGIGLKLGEMKIDYAYYRDTLVMDNSSHFISVSMSFPGVASRKAEKKVREINKEQSTAESGVTAAVPTPEAKPVLFITEEAKKIPEQPSSGLTEQKVRNYINLLDSKIKAYKAKGNVAKVKELRKEKQKTLNKWKAVQKKHTAPKKTVKKTAAKKTSSQGLAEKKAKDYITLLNSKIKKYKAKGNTAKVKELQIERQRAVDRWQEIRRRPVR